MAPTSVGAIVVAGRNSVTRLRWKYLHEGAAMVRTVFARVLLALAIPLTFVSLIDALEGGLVLLLVGVLLTVAFVLERHRPPKYLWIPYLVAFLLAVLTLVLAFTTRAFEPGPTAGPPLPVITQWFYRAAVLSLLVSTVVYFVRSFRRPPSN